MTPDDPNIAYVRAALAYDATYLDGDTPVAPGVTLAAALRCPERVVQLVWESALRIMRIPYDGPVDFDALARFVSSNLMRRSADASTIVGVGLRALRVATKRENSK